MFSIDKKWVGDGYPPYIIAELSANHNGSLETVNSKWLLPMWFELLKLKSLFLSRKQSIFLNYVLVTLKLCQKKYFILFFSCFHNKKCMRICCIKDIFMSLIESRVFLKYKFTYFENLQKIVHSSFFFKLKSTTHNIYSLVTRFFNKFN